MSSNGKVLKGLGLPKDLNFSKTHVVLVTGQKPNTCGHILLYVGGSFGHYFHFDGPSLFEYPRYLEGDGAYRTYLSTTGKTELLRKPLTIPHPALAEKKLAELMDRKWGTLIISHNCASFVAQVIHAGGNFWTMPDHCPVLDMGVDAFLTSIFGKAREALGTEEAYQRSLLK